MPSLGLVLEGTVGRGQCQNRGQFQGVATRAILPRDVAVSGEDGKSLGEQHGSTATILLRRHNSQTNRTPQSVPACWINLRPSSYSAAFFRCSSMKGVSCGR